MRVGACHADGATFERLAQTVEYGALEFRQFVKKQHAEMGEADFTRFHPQTTTDQCGHGGRMVRGAEWPGAHQLPALQLPGDRGDHRHLKRFGGRKVGQNAGQTGCE